MTSSHSPTDARLDQIAADVALLVERQRRVDELLTEFGPIMKEMMGVGITRLQDAESAGYFRAGNALVGAVDRVVRGRSPEELDGLGDDLVRILDTLRLLTRPDLLGVVAEVAGVVDRRDELAPIGVIGMVRASGDLEVQRGMAVLLELTRHVGRAAHRVGQPSSTPPVAERATPAARSVHPGLEALAPRRRKATATASCATPSGPGMAVTQLDGIGFTADGFVAEPEKWTPALGATLAAQAGVAMTEAHWALVNFARKEWLETSVSPNIRRLSIGAGVSTKDIYTLFKKAPGRTIARIAGVPKPAGCL